jgi:hypothetical protein
MKKFLFLFLLFVTFITIDADAAPAYAFRVKFKDKNGTLSFADSLQFLSPKSLERRWKQSIALDSTDLPVVQAYIDTVMNVSSASRLQSVSKWFNQIVVITFDSSKAALVAALPMVEKVTFVARYNNGVFKTNPPVTKFPEVQAYQGKTTGTSAYYGLSFQQIDQIDVDCLHDLGFRGENMDIAVFDVNFRFANTCSAYDSLKLQNRVKDVYNFARDTAYVYSTAIASSHGMNVLGCMAANIPGTYVGSAPYGNFFLYITEDILVEAPIEEDNWLMAAERADSIGVYLINSSLGYNIYNAPLSSASYTYANMDGQTSLLVLAANKAVSKGMFVVNAQGNEGLSAWHYMLTPADGDSVYSVGSVDGSGLWGGSGYGPTYDGTVKPDGMAMGKGTSLIGDNCSVGAANGSSFASPIMCGAIACLWQALPHLKNWQLRNLVRMSSDRYTNTNNTHGFGIPNFCTAYQIALGTSDVQSIDYTFSLYPNPSQGEFYIKSYDPSITEFAVTIYDITGRLIYKSSKMVQSNYYVDALKNVPAGDYVVLISTVNKQYSSKITKR